MPRPTLRSASTPRPASGGGFTLIELLVVISIIALLISILLPVLGSARETARNATCLSNLKQWGVSVAIYSTEFKQHLPQEGTGTNPATDTSLARWYNALPKGIDYLPYFEVFEPALPTNVFEDQNIWWCPTARAEFGRPEATGTGRAFDYAWSYVLNGTGSRGPNFGTNHLKLDTIPPLSSTLAISEPSGRNEGVSINTLDADRHAGGRNVNVLFLDSHVAGAEGNAANTVSSGAGTLTPRVLWKTADDTITWGSFR